MEETLEVTGPKRVQNENVDGFDYQQYVSHFPTELHGHLTEVFSTHAYGWKSRARQVLKIVRGKQEVERLYGDLAAICAQGKIPVSKDPIDRARVSLRVFIASLTEDKVEELCKRVGVSFDSFSNDPANRIEALIDEMVVV